MQRHGGDMSRGTANRNVRVEDELWEEAKAVAKLKGETLSDVIRRALRKYIEEK